MGSGSLPTTTIYCIYDYQNYIGGNYFENNCYWTIGANAKLAQLSTIDYTRWLEYYPPGLLSELIPGHR